MRKDRNKFNFKEALKELEENSKAFHEANNDSTHDPTQEENNIIQRRRTAYSSITMDMEEA